MVETNDEWITTRTGIEERRVLAEGELLSTHATLAAERALEQAQVRAEDLDLILLATSTADDIFGSATMVQHKLGASNAVAFDITSACSGFVVALITGSQYIRCGTFKKVLVIGGDALSRFVDWNDRNTCILFGDGCGAAVLDAVQLHHDGGKGAKEEEGGGSLGGCNLLSFAMESDGSGRKHLNASYSGCPDKTGSSLEEVRGEDSSYANIAMSGQDVFKWAVRAVPAVVNKALLQTNLSVDDVDWLVLHQANKRILAAAGDRLKIPSEKIVSNIAQYGNTSAGSIPLALDEAIREGKIKSGDVIASAGFGAGLTCAAAIFIWD
jgi:3-oxoacyl-[acyl-carrier-protein] synthase-3